MAEAREVASVSCRLYPSKFRCLSPSAPSGVLLYARSSRLPAYPVSGVPQPAWRDSNALLLSRRLGNDGKPLWASRSANAEIGMLSNHECNSSLSRLCYENELVAFSPTRPELPLRMIHRPAESSYVGEIDLHWEANRLLLTQSNASNWKVFELSLEGGDLRPVTQLPDDVDCYDACYLPDGRVVFGSSAPMQAVPCWHGLRKATNLPDRGDQRSARQALRCPDAAGRPGPAPVRALCVTSSFGLPSGLGISSFVIPSPLPIPLC